MTIIKFILYNQIKHNSNQGIKVKSTPFIYPKPLTQNSKIGITGPSGGVHERFTDRYNLAIKHLINQGYEIVEGSSLKGEFKHVSGPKHKRAEDFMDLWMRDDIDAIIPPWGGELLIEILPLLDFERMNKAKPKWVMGYSDISTLLFPLTMLTGIVSAHGTNLLEMIPAQTDELTKNCLLSLTKEQGSLITQKSSEFFQTKGPSFISEFEHGFKATEKTLWKTLDNKPCRIKGRVIGGCLDTLAHLIGTPYGNLEIFKKLAGNDGVVLYFENAESSPCSVARILWSMQLAGWFEKVNGVVLGRSSAAIITNENNLNYVEVIGEFFKELNLPLIYDVDIGHQQPNLTILNGSLSEFSIDELGRGMLVTHLA
jgi:muramoyltetrapeptide carboxypeptidase LdcA involved in peptidoglycan recycling